MPGLPVRDDWQVFYIYIRDSRWLCAGFAFSSRLGLPCLSRSLFLIQFLEWSMRSVCFSCRLSKEATHNFADLHACYIFLYA